MENVFVPNQVLHQKLLDIEKILTPQSQGLASVGTVEGQFITAEIKQFHELTASVSSMQKDLSSIKSTLMTVLQIVGNLSKDDQTIMKNQDQLNAEETAIATALANLQTTSTSIDTNVKAVAGVVSTLEQEVADLKTAAADAGADLDFTGLDAQVAQLGTTTTALSADNSTLAGIIPAVSTPVTPTNPITSVPDTSATDVKPSQAT